MLFNSKEGWCFLPLFCLEQWVCFDYSTLVLLGADLQLLSLSYTQTAHLDPDPEPSNIFNSCLHESGRMKNPADLFYWRRLENQCWAAYLSLRKCWDLTPIDGGFGSFGSRWWQRTTALPLLLDCVSRQHTLSVWMSQIWPLFTDPKRSSTTTDTGVNLCCWSGWDQTYIYREVATVRETLTDSSENKKQH